MEHTGIAASWCPVCGDCICPRDEDGEPIEMQSEMPVPFGSPKQIYIVHDPYCPLHGWHSKHGEE